LAKIFKKILVNTDICGVTQSNVYSEFEMIYYCIISKQIIRKSALSKLIYPNYALTKNTSLKSKSFVLLQLQQQTLVM